MANSALMDLIIEAENRLGIAPTGRSIRQARNLQHRILSDAMAKHQMSVRDLHLALSYCDHRREHLTRLSQLIGFVRAARELQASQTRTSESALSIDEAISWEYEHPDEHQDYWITLLGRAVGPLRKRILLEWRKAGRGGTDAAVA